jgi:hypothetical protein
MMMIKETKIINIKIWDLQEMLGCKLGLSTWRSHGGISRVKGGKRKNNPSLFSITSVMSCPKSGDTSGSV